MSDTMTIWDATSPLSMGRPLLIEASAGTGKTYQMTSLVARLVVEVEVPISELLVITFTNAATSELRQRILSRLSEVRDMLAQDTPPSEDPVLRALWRDSASERKMRARLVQVALHDFDRAPISTIHGFSQRTLAQLAFESGQESELSLMADTRPLIAEIVDDEVARIYARADTDELDQFQEVGLDRDGLSKLAHYMVQAVPPRPVPAVAPGDPVARDPFEAFAVWAEEAKRLQAWWEPAAGEEVRREFAQAYEQKSINGKTLGQKYVNEALDEFTQWLAGGAPYNLAANTTRVAKYLSESMLRKAWREDVPSLEQSGILAFIRRVDAVRESQEGLWARAKAGFAERVRETLEREIKRRGLITYDTMLSRLAERIERPDEGPDGALARAIRHRYRAALVDEFQDTDRAQWTVLRAVFEHPERYLIVVGDPKQAIYAFRGADVHVYLDAAKTAERRTMNINWRSDKPLVEAQNTLWGNLAEPFLHSEVQYIEVSAQEKHSHWRLVNPPPVRLPPGDETRPRRAMELRWVDGTALGQETPHISNKERGEKFITAACVREAADLLGRATEIVAGKPPEKRRLHPGDIAVLVQTNKQCEVIRAALQSCGIPAVSAGRGNVYSSPAAKWVAAFLDTLAAPGRDAPARFLAATPLFGWSALELAVALDRDAVTAEQGQRASGGEEARERNWGEWLARHQKYARRYAKSGFVSALEEALTDGDLLAELLGSFDGERHATNLRHLMELCHAEERRSRLGPAGLAAWLRDRIREAADDQDGSEETEIRLESDARAIQIVTVHKSKGLEYPVVLLPFLWSEWEPGKSELVRYHGNADGTPGDGNELLLDVNPRAMPGGEEARAAQIKEELQERRRLVYVALTRAATHVIAWLGPIGNTNQQGRESALGEIVLGDATDHDDRDPTSRLEALADRSGGAIGWAFEAPLARDCARVSLEPPPTAEPVALPWDPNCKLLSRFQRASYSSLAPGKKVDDDERIREEVELLDTTDEDPARAPDADEDHPLMVPREPTERPGASEFTAPAPLAELPGGKEVGTWVHSVLEHLDFTTGRPRAPQPLAKFLRDHALRCGITKESAAVELQAKLPRILETPLDCPDSRLAPGFALANLATGDRLDEMRFDLRLGHGNRYVRRLAREDAAVVDPRAVRVALEGRTAPWRGADWLLKVLGRKRPGRDGGLEDAPVFPEIAGFLTGFIDLIMRVERDSDPVYWVVDYKTNRIVSRLGAPGARALSLQGHYTQPWLEYEMARGGFHFQSLLYTLALHRLLRATLKEKYDYERNVGGHLYLFLRGMGGRDSARDDDGFPLGVYFDRWPREVVFGLDLALTGASPQEVLEVMR